MSGSARPGDGLRAIGAASFLLARRARRDLVALLGLLILTALTTGVAFAVPHEIDATLDAAAVEAVAAAGSDADLTLLSTVADPSGYDTTTAERLLAFAAELPQRLPRTLMDVVDGIGTGLVGPDLPATGPGGDVVLRLGVLDPAATGDVRLVAGTLPPTEDPGTGAAAGVVSSATAAAAGLSIGSVVTIDEAMPERAVSLLVTGIVETDDPDAVAWADLPGVWVPESSGTSGGGEEVVVTALTGAASFDRVAPLLPAPSAGSIRVTVDPELFDLARTEAVGREVDALETSTASLTEGAPLSVSARSGYEDALADLPDAATAATAQLSSVAAGLLGVAVLVTGLAGSALARRRRPETALLRSHGASLGLIGIHAGLESVAVTLLGVGIGAAAARASGAPPESPGLAITAACVLVAAPVLATVRPLLRPLPVARARVLRLAGAGVLVAMAATAVAALRGGGRASGSGVDPLALVAPVLCAAVIALALAPLPSALLAPLRRAAARTRGPGPLLAGASASEGRSVLTLATLVLAASAALTSLILLQTVAAGQEASSWRAVGADVRIDEVADGPALAATLGTGGATAASVVRLDRIEVEGPTNSLSATVLGVGSDYADLLEALPADQPQHASAEAVRGLADAAGPLPALVDARLAATVGADPFTLDVDGVPLEAVVAGSPVLGPGWIDGPIVLVDRERLLAVTSQAAAPPPLTTVLAVGPGVGAQAPDGAILRADVLGAQRGAALVAGVTDATRRSLLATAALAVLALVVTTVLGARRRGGTLALLSALGVPRRARLVLAAGELVPLVASGVVGGAVAAAVVLAAAWPAFGVAVLVGGPAELSIPLSLPLGVLGVAVAALALALAIDAPLSRRVRTADILRSGEES